MDKYCKNFILSGEIDYYCVLCQESFGDVEDVERHMRWEKHRKDLKLQEYLHKYKKDFIYKINDIYYCEVCNLATTDVAGHINQEIHQAQKVKPERISKKSDLVKQEPNGTIKVNEKIVLELQWHGLKDGKCSVCDRENIRQVNTHILTATHMSNLIETHIKCEGDMCYRELKNNKCYCFTCFETYDKEYLANHWTDKHSKQNENKNSAPDENKTQNTEQESECDSNNNIDKIMIKVLAKTRAMYYDIDVAKKTAKCLLCAESVEPTSKALDKHSREYHPGTELIDFIVTDQGKRRQELAKYARENSMKLNEGGSKMFCTLCDIFTSAHMNCATQHVNGSLHRSHLELKGLLKDTEHEKPPVKPIPCKSFIKDSNGPFNIAQYAVMVFNEGICVEVISFALIRLIEGFQGLRGKCYACGVTLNFSEILKHSKAKDHRNIVLKSKVLPMERDNGMDLIREIHPSLYHCGVCNKVFPFWENMAKHLRSFTHKVQRSKKKLLSDISAKLFLTPFLDLDDIDEYKRLLGLDGIN